MKTFIQQLFKDKNNNYSLRELCIAVFIAMIIISWIAQQFFRFAIPEFMFYAFVSLVGAGCFGYSIERRTIGNEQAPGNG
jgi:hypothetical protein